MTSATPPAPTLPRLQSDWQAERHSNNGWPQFLESVWLGATEGGQGIRGWMGDTVQFRFPVVAISGQNGSGKSTVLKAAAAAYRARDVPAPGAQEFSPDDFFPSTPWESVSGVWLEYVVKQGERETSTHTLRKPTSRWRGMTDRPRRNTYFLDVSRTQPIDTLIGYGKLAAVRIAEGTSSLALNAQSTTMLSNILGRTYTEGSILSDESGKQVGVVETGGRRYSNYHQGAGEDATADFVALLQQIPRNSLVLIDEVEASLHPKAQRRLITEIIGVARERRVQFIVTTHSPYVLDQLPLEARVHIQADRNGEKEVMYAATPEYAMSLMDDRAHPELTIFCEDPQAEYICEAIIRRQRPALLPRVKILPVGPASTVRTLGELAVQSKLAGRCIGLLDGDQVESEGCAVLPGGNSPEKAAFESLEDDHWELVAQVLTVSAGELLDAKDDAMRVANHHTWANRTASNLYGTVRPSKVWEAVADIWVKRVLGDNEREALANSIEEALTA